MGLIQSQWSHHPETKACSSTLKWLGLCVVCSAVYVPHKFYLHSFLINNDVKHYQFWSLKEGKKNVAFLLTAIQKL